MRITSKTHTVADLESAIVLAGKNLAAESSGNIQVMGTLPNITLRAKSSSGPMARRHASGRKSNSANWNAHRIFLDVLFTFAPNTRIKTALITYKDAAHFYKAHPGTAAFIVKHCGQESAFGDL